MKAYIACSREAGSSEGAVLVFAHNIREAKHIARTEPSCLDEILDGAFLDLHIRLIEKAETEYLLNHVPQWSKDKLAKDKPHIVDSPPSCDSCEMWGYVLDENQRCESCADDYAYNLI